MFSISNHWMAALAWTLAMVIYAFTHGVALADDGHGHSHMAVKNDATGIIVSNARMPVPAPGIGTAAVYLELKNGSGHEVDLVAVESAGFAMAHLHKTSMVDGLMSMEALAQLSIPAGQAVTFEPKGLHVMLMGPKQTYSVGERIPLTFILADGRRIDVDASVVAPRDAVGQDHGAMPMN